MTQATELLTLQEFDDEAAILRMKLADVERRLEANEELDAARESLASAEARRAEVHREQRRLEDQVATLTSRIAPEEKRLYGGSVKNPKELSSIQHELELLTAQRSRLEDELVEVLDQVDAADSRQSEARETVTRLEALWQTQQNDLHQERERLNEAITGADARVARQKAAIDPPTLRTYEGLRRRKDGPVVVKIQGRTCSGCRIGIPDAVRTRALAGTTLAQCPSCERILFVG
jgi:uncharacterized protein